MAKSPAAAESVPRSVRIPVHLIPKIRAAMEYEGIRSFSAFGVSALILKCRRIDDAKAREERQRNLP